ncbi:MAG: hypothetical protein IKA72_02135 [Clostridia bacterium]|nr:hypothetical protein [Clostridia bacterium]
MRKKKVIAITACLCAITTFLGSCSRLGGDLLVKPASAERLSIKEYSEENFVAFKNKAEQFSAKFAFETYARSDRDDNLSVAPMSVFMALSLVSECASGDTKTELLNALGVSDSELKEFLPKLYRQLNVEYKGAGYIGEPTTGLLKTSNSIWIDESVTYNAACVETLAKNYYCYPYQANFKENNALANYAVQGFVKEQTKGLIDENFHLSEETLFTFINTIYLKALWNDKGKDIPLTSQTYDFIERSGEIERTRLMMRGYLEGRAYESESYTSFFTTTYNGFKLKFILPKDGYSIDDVFTTENIYTANTISDYNAVDHEKKEQYYTRCFFPEYEAECDENILPVLKEKFGVNSLFEWDRCELNELTDTPLVCGEVRHITELEVDRKGIEGAAVTLMQMASSSAPGEYTKVYFDFVVDRAFGFVITDSYGATLFSGVVNELD